VAPTDSTVLLLGESGTGKEVLATMIHRLSVRRDHPFVAINCAALPEALLESEMFGHVRGAFTGADRDKRGLFEESDSGTIFLDEIGDMSLVTQSKLLRVLQNGEIRPVGSSEMRRVDVRVIAATNKDLEQRLAENTFREDLYYRISVIPVRLPPLRERCDDIALLALHFLRRFAREMNKPVHKIEPGALRCMEQYHWPGNVRELENAIERAVILAQNPRIEATDLPQENRLAAGSALPEQSLTEVEKNHILSVLGKTGSNYTRAAKILKISRATLYNKVRAYGLGVNKVNSH
jgi:transcriptional regulator with PAS, ATPase and Fis domain